MRYLIYDGECPFCARYVDFLNLKKRFPDIELLDAVKTVRVPVRPAGKDEERRDIIWR